MKLSPNWLLASALPLLTEAVPLSCLGTTVNAFLCPNTSSKAPEHPNRSENKFTYPAYSNTSQRQETDLRSTMHVFLFILRCCTRMQVLVPHNRATPSYSSKRNYVLLYKTQTKLTHQSSSTFYKVPY